MVALGALGTPPPEILSHLHIVWLGATALKCRCDLAAVVPLWCLSAHPENPARLSARITRVIYAPMPWIWLSFCFKHCARVRYMYFFSVLVRLSRCRRVRMCGGMRHGAVSRAQPNVEHSSAVG